jgi:DNA ligase-1
LNKFAILFHELDQTSNSSQKAEALKSFLNNSEEVDILWALALLTGKTNKKALNTKWLKGLATEISGLSDWLFEESHAIVGDLVETISLLVGNNNPIEYQKFELSDWIVLMEILSTRDEETKKELVAAQWKKMNQKECLVFNKLITGSLKFGISQKELIQGISEAFSLDPLVINHCLSQNWDPVKITLKELIFENGEVDDLPKPFPFATSIPVENQKDLGEEKLWHSEWKWDGMRCQIICREGKIWIWNHAEELITDKFPELNLQSLNLKNGTVLDAEIIPFQNGKILPNQVLQTRNARKSLSKKQLQDSPIAVFVSDILECNGIDIRFNPLTERRKILEKIIKNANSELLFPSESIPFHKWKELDAIRNSARKRMASGLLLKRMDSMYPMDSETSTWKFWKPDSMQLTGVLMYIQKGPDLISEYTLGLWDGTKLTSITKVKTGLSQLEIKEIDAFVKKNTIEKFGPVRTVKPELVFEIEFEGLQVSSRHKSGMLLKSPQIICWRKDKTVDSADTLDYLKTLLI